MPVFTSDDPLGDVARLVPRVYAYVAYRVGSGPDAEDITSDVFERAVRYRASYDPRRGEPINWLIGIARRSIDSFLATGTQTNGDLGESADRSELEAETLRRLTVAAAVAQLDARDRELVALRYGSDLSARQIAALLGMRTNAVEVALHRARAQLRQLLESDT